MEGIKHPKQRNNNTSSKQRETIEQREGETIEQREEEETVKQRGEEETIEKTLTPLDNKMETKRVREECLEESGPRTLVCCVCGRQFGTHSLRIHYPQCLLKFRAEQQTLRKGERRECAQMSIEDKEAVQRCEWRQQKRKDFNRRAQEQYRKYTLMSCPNCMRKFFPQSLLKHQKNCVLLNGRLNSSINKSVGEKSIKSIKEKVFNNIQEGKDSSVVGVRERKPRVLVCYLCGREFGLTSLLIHQKICKERAQKKALVGQSAFGDFLLEKSESWSHSMIAKHNQIATGLYRDKVLKECIHCGRRFFEEQLPKHLKHCAQHSLKLISKKSIKSQKGKKMNQNEVEVSNKIKSGPRVLMCHMCGREFGLCSLRIHLPQCRDKIIKRGGKVTEMDSDVTETQKWSMQQIVAYNQRASIVYRSCVLKECIHCGRKFFEEQLPKHLKHCQKVHLEVPDKISRTQSSPNPQLSCTLEPVSIEVNEGGYLSNEDSQEEDGEEVVESDNSKQDEEDKEQMEVEQGACEEQTVVDSME